MKPVIIGNATLYCGDCEDAMPLMTDNAFDLAIVDPPYGDTVKQGGYMQNKMGKKTHQHAYNNALWKMKAPDSGYFDSLFRVSANQIIWGANHFIDAMPRPSACWIVWDKNRPEQHWADGELAWASFDQAMKIKRFTWDGFRQEDMKNKELRIHPTQKPVALYRWLLQTYAKPGQSILDTHLGSGSSVIACLDRGHHVTAYEINQQYFDEACERIERAQQQLKLEGI